MEIQRNNFNDDSDSEEEMRGFDLEDIPGTIRVESSSEDELYGFYDSDDLDDDGDSNNYNDVDMESDVEEENGARPDDRAWGRNSSRFYSTDFIDPDRLAFYRFKEAEFAELEEEEARRIQNRLANDLNETDFVDALRASEVQITENENYEEIARNISALTTREKLDLMQRESPEFFVLIQDLKSKLNEIDNVLIPVLTYFGNKQDMPAPVKFLKKKFLVLTNYCTNITFYILLKAKRSPVQNHPVLKSLYKYRRVMEEIQEIDEAMKPKIEKVLMGIKDSQSPALEKLKSSIRKKNLLNLLKKSKEEQNKNDGRNKDWEPTPSTSAEPVPGTSKEPVSGIFKKPVSGIFKKPVPGTSKEPLPGTSKEPVSGIFKKPVSGIFKKPVSGTSKEPVSGIFIKPVPGTSKEPLPGTSKEPVSGIFKKPVSGIFKKPVPGTSKEPLPGTSKELVSGIFKKPVPGTSKEPVSGIFIKPVPGTSTEPVSGIFKKPVSGIFKKPVPGTSKEPLPGTSKELVSGIFKKPVPGTSKEPVSGIFIKPVPGTSKEPVPETFKTPVSGIFKKPVSGIFKKPTPETSAEPIPETSAEPIPGTSAGGSKKKQVENEKDKRAITYQMAKNKGLMPKRNKLQRNPRVKHRNKYRKALIRRRGQVRFARTEIPVYGGEPSGIKAHVTKSIKFN